MAPFHRAALLLGALLAAAGAAWGRFVVEESALRVVLPDSAKAQYPAGFDMALANFGERAEAQGHRPLCQRRRKGRRRRRWHGRFPQSVCCLQPPLLGTT